MWPVEALMALARPPARLFCALGWLADGRADFLTNRIVSGPHPAIRDMVYEEHDGKYVITGGEFCGRVGECKYKVMG